MSGGPTPPARDPLAARRLLYGALDHLAPNDEAEVMRLAVELGLHSRSRVLELGCGTGFTACTLAREVGCEVTATDLDPLFLDLALERAAREGVAARVRVRMADMRALYAFFPSERFDAVIALGSLHEGGLGRVGPDVRGLLAPEGTFAFSLLTWRRLDEDIPPDALADWPRIHEELFGAGAPDIDLAAGAGGAGGAGDPDPDPDPADGLISRLEPTLDRLARAGFRKGFAYEVGVPAWETYARGLARALERFGEAGGESAEADRLFRGLTRLLARGGADEVGWYVYGGFPDAAGDPGATPPAPARVEIEDPAAESL